MIDKNRPSLTEILLVEDSKTQVVLLKRMLEHGGFKVDVVSNGQEALEWFKSNAPRPVLTDVTMPLVDGYQLCAALKQDSRFALIPVVLLASLRRNDDLAEILASKADGFIYKEFDSSYFVSLLEAIIKQIGDSSLRTPVVDLKIGQAEFSSPASRLTSLLLCAFNTAVYCRSRLDSQIQQ